ncbi:uncharacterized protein KY384_003943 [Bacidia gigantensis]|uniref:uncharacterized protein n=1 Tax=Bacidia gigantensis TaxID=2732470 RepID=UPI001D04E1DA|nr:uncharacterized protein KY384_003943 [Bacidia gigantensis]KAG8532302.1 hypothetical protein KY384_003943 [Bacidia gigantensis]
MPENKPFLKHTPKVGTGITMLLEPQNLDYSTTKSTGETIEQWSPFIGIVTAIIGNILISFALNIQRYAHIRLGQEFDEKKSLRHNERSKPDKKDYGTQQSDVAEERARLNLKTQQWDNGRTVDDEDPSKLVKPKSSHSSLRSDTSTDSTIKPSEKNEQATERKTYLKSPYWWAGIVLMIVGEAGNFLAYGFAPASIVSPLGVVALICNCIIAPCLLKEAFRQRDFWGVMIAIGGTVTIVLSAKTSEKKLGPDDVWAAITRWEFETYLGITVGLIIILMWASPRYGHRSILIDLGLVGLFGEYTALSTKGIASLLSDTLWRTLTFPVTYLLIFVLVGTAIMQIRYVNRALQRFDSTQVIPIQFVSFTLSVIIGSAVLYRDFESAPAAEMGKFVGGCLLTFFGVYLITSGRARGHDDFGAYDDDEENTIGLVDEERFQDEMDVPSKEQARRQSSTSPRFNGSQMDSRRSSKQQPFPAISTPSRRASQASTASSEFDSSLAANPWRSSDELSSAPRRPTQTLESTISQPLLPSQAASTSQTPETPSTPDRPSLSQRSKTRLTPGPLMSPLSPSFSAIVADQRRRSSVAQIQARRPTLTQMRKSRSSRGSNGVSGELAITEASPLKHTRTADDMIPEERPSMGDRSRSVRASMARFFKKESKGKSQDRSGDQSEF